LLPARCDRPRRRCAAKKRDELAAPHWLILPVLLIEDSTIWVWQETAALRHFNPANVAVGSKSENITASILSPLVLRFRTSRAYYSFDAMCQKRL
jgi:hypothetical protein